MENRNDQKKYLDKNHDPKLHFSERQHKNPPANVVEKDVNLNDKHTRERLTHIAADETARQPIYSTDRGKSKPDDKNTGRWQSTTFKGKDPTQTQSPDVGANNSVEEEYKKDPFHAQYGLNHANKGSHMSTDKGSGRGEKGLKGTTEGRQSKGMNQSLNMGRHEGNRKDKNG